ncbi:MAG: D-alanyl-D-alanine carboxypeptidase [Peptococcaceae bacterium]|nr:D-alanyl-D-alanine carboxypeptidase [Peptococcaceae bacterium]
MLKKISLWVCLAAFLLSAAVFPAAAASPVITGEAAVLVDSKNGQVLFEKNASVKVYQASTTKILTAIIALESARTGEMVTIPKEASDVEGSAVGLQEGEQVSLEDLLYALMLNSGNDSAVAIACHLGGSVPGFVQMMNKRAAELGAVNTHFNNPNGLPDPNHYTTARDMALIARYTMQNPEFREIVSTKVKTITRSDPNAQTYLDNHNKLLWNYDGAIGVKTGYTDEARQCLVSAAARQGRELIAVVMKSEGTDIWTDSTKLLDFGFAEFNQASLVEAGKFMADVPVRYGVAKTVRAQTGSSLVYDFPIGAKPQISQEITLFDNIAAPLQAGKKVGEAAFYANGQELGRVDLVAQQEVKRRILAKWWFWLLVLAAIATAAAIALYQNEMRRRRWQMYNKRKYYL